MTMLRRWNYDEQVYEPYEVPDNWNVKSYSEDMDEIVSVVTQASKADTQDNVKGILSSVASFQEVIVGFVTNSTFGIDHGNRLLSPP